MELSSDPAQLLQQGALIKGQKTRYFNVFVRSMESFEKEGPTGASWGILQDAKEKYEDGALHYTMWCSTVYDVCAAAADGTVVDREQRLAAIAKEQTKFETQDAAVSSQYLRCACLWEVKCELEAAQTAPPAAGSSGSCKSVEGLKPSLVASVELTPEQFADWQLSAEAWADQSNFDKASTAAQQQYFRKIVEHDMFVKMQAPAMASFRACLLLAKEVFEKHYLWFSVQREADEPWGVFYLRLVEYMKLADLDTMKAMDHVKYMLLTQLSTKMRERVMAAGTDPTIENMVAKIAEQEEFQRTTMELNKKNHGKGADNEADLALAHKERVWRQSGRKRGAVIGQEVEEPELQARKGLGSSFTHEASPHQPPTPITRSHLVSVQTSF